MNEHALSTRELATVLAALRLFQRTDSAHSGPENVIASSGGEIEPLSTAEIDLLCERLNIEPVHEQAQYRDVDWEAQDGMFQGVQAAYLNRLRAAGVDETPFDQVFQSLSSDGFMDTAQVSAIAAAYTGDGATQYASRDEALGAIEDHFRQGREQINVDWAEQDAAFQDVGNLRAARELAEAYLSVAEVRNAAGHHPTTFAPNITYDEAAERADINPSLRAPVTCLLIAGGADAWEWAHEIRNGIFPQLESLRGAVLDEAEFAAALQALRADPAIDEARAAQIARAFTWNENAKFSSRDEAFGVIAAKGSSWRTGVHQPPAESCFASYLDRLQTAGAHEGAFDQVFQALRCDGFMDTAQVSAIAAAYTGDGVAQYASRDEALGTIESEFYARVQGQAQEQAAAQGGGRS